MKYEKQCSHCSKDFQCTGFCKNRSKIEGKDSCYCPECWIQEKKTWISSVGDRRKCRGWKQSALSKNMW